MISLLNKKTNKPEMLDETGAQISLILEPEKYAPIPDNDYFIKDQSGNYQKVKGRDLFKVLEGAQLVTEKKAEVDLAVRAEHSQIGQFLKGFHSEAVLLGLDKEYPQTPEEAVKEEARQRIFGPAETTGRILGSVGPLLASGLGGLVAKGATKGIFKAIGQAPSAYLFKGADKIGKATKEAMKRAGGGKTAQALAQAGGSIAGFSAIEGTLAGVKQTIATRATPKFKGDKKVYNSMSTALGAGIRSAGETFSSTAVTIAGMSAGLKAVGLGIKGVGATKKALMGEQTAKELLTEGLRSRFWKVSGSPSGRMNREILNRKIAKKSDTQSQALKKLEQIIIKEKLDVPMTRDKFFEGLKKRVDKVGKNIGSARKELIEIFKAYPAWGQPSIVKAAKQNLKKSLEELIVKGPEGATIYRKFNADINRIIQTIDHKDFNPFLHMKKLMDIFSKSARFTAREGKELKVDRLYRNAYRITSDSEDIMYKLFRSYHARSSIGSKTTPKISKKALDRLKNEKDRFSILKDIEEISRRSFPSELRVWTGFQTFRDISLLAGGGALIAGSPVLAGAGFLAAGIGGIAAHKGFGYLQMARILEGANTLTRKSRTPKGVKNLLTTVQKIPGTIENIKQEIGIKGLGFLFFNKTINHIKDFHENLYSMDDIDKTSTNNNFEGLFSMIGDYGGLNNVTFSTLKMNQLKRTILAKMPLPKKDYRGNIIYDKENFDIFLRDLNRWITPAHFVSAVKRGDITSKAYKTFGDLYPNFLSFFNLNFLIGWKDKTIDIEEGQFYKNFLDSQNSLMKDLMYSYIDIDDNQGQNNRKMTPKRKMRSPSPTISANIEGGLS